MSSKSREIPSKDLLVGVNRTAKATSKATISLLIVLFYVVLMVLSVNDEVLLRESGVKMLPFNVDLPLNALSLMAPPTLLVLHLLFLIKIEIMRRHVSHHRAGALLEWRWSAKVRPLLASQRLTVRPDQELFGVLVHSLFWSLNLLPPVVLIWIEYRFLPLQSEVSRVHAGAVCVDSVVIFWFLLVMPWVAKGCNVYKYMKNACLVFKATLVCAAALAILSWSMLACSSLRRISLKDTVLVARMPPDDLLVKLLEQGVSEDEVLRRYAKGLDLRGRKLKNADLSGSKLYNARLEGADLSGATLRGADLSGARLSSEGDVLSDSYGGTWSLHSGNLSGADLTNAKLISAHLENCNLSSARLVDANLSGSFMRNAKFLDADLTRATFSFSVLDYVDMSGATLVDGILVGTSLRGANASGGDFTGAWLIGADLSESTLILSSFRGADLTRADFSEANTLGANFHAANLLGVYKLNAEGALLEGANGREGCICVDCLHQEVASSNLLGLRWSAEKGKEVTDINELVQRRFEDESDLEAMTSFESRSLIDSAKIRVGGIKVMPCKPTLSRRRTREVDFVSDIAHRLILVACSEGEASTDSRLAEIIVTLVVRRDLREGGLTKSLEEELASRQWCSRFRRISVDLRRQLDWRLDQRYSGNERWGVEG